MSFPSHEGIFRSDGRGSCRSGARSERLHAPTHRLDEFPTGYSSAGWSPPQPASASPAKQKFTMKAAPQPSLFQRMGKPCLAGCLTTGAHAKQFRERLEHINRPQPPGDHDRQAFPRILLDDGEDLQRPAVMRAVRHEVIRPDVVPIRRPVADARAIREPQPARFACFCGTLRPSRLYTETALDVSCLHHFRGMLLRDPRDSLHDRVRADTPRLRIPTRLVCEGHASFDDLERYCR